MEFIKKYEAYSTIQLLRIIDSPNDYQPDAVEAAKAIISNRQLSEEEFEIARDGYNAEKQEEERKEKGLKDNLKNVYNSIFDIINPMKGGSLVAEKRVKIISAVLVGLFLFQLYQQLKMLYITFLEIGWDTFFIVVPLLPLIFIATVIVLFYKRKKTGWFMLTVYLIFSAVSEIETFVVFMTVNFVGVEAFSITLLYPTPIRHVLKFIFYTAIAWIISRENVRSVYSINEKTMIYTISITTLIMVLIEWYLTKGSFVKF